MDTLTFWQHVQVFRVYLFWYVFAFIVSLVVVHNYFDVIITYLLLPLGENPRSLQFLSPLDPLIFMLKVDVIVTFYVTLPLLIFLLWRFLSPALEKNHVFRIGLTIVGTTIFSYMAIGYGYAAIAPTVMSFMNSLVHDGTEIAFTAQGYINFIFSTIFILVIISQIPLLITVASALNIINPHLISAYRREIYVGILIMSAIITPTTDIFTLLLICIPAILVTEIGILIAKISR